MTTFEQLETRLLRLSRQGLREVVRPVLLETARLVEARGKLNVTESFHTRTGRLRASVGAEVEERDGALALVARAGGQAGRGIVRYARLQEMGGVQRPTSGKYLRIPVPGGPALTAAGVDRYPSPLRSSAPEGFFRVQKTLGGKLFLVHDVKGAQGRTDFWYQLVRQVTIPARPFLRPAVDRGVEHLRIALPRAIMRAAGGQP